MNGHDLFTTARNDAFDAVIRHIESRCGTGTLADVRLNAEKDCWTLLLNGVSHLKSGAPGRLPGALNEALSKASLRASPLAAALGVKPPQFEPILLGADYADGREAALFLCGKLLDGALEDFEKSRRALQQKILAEKPAEELKRQMALSCDALTESYARVCAALREDLRKI